MEVGVNMQEIQLIELNVIEIGYDKDPNVKEGVYKGKTNGPKEIVNDSQESLEGRALNDMAELAKEIFAGFHSAIIIASNTLRCIMVVIILLLCI
ncbi:hypothetical protein X943_002733 [Babesia divergens]|uniref:Uncharacterized protein n=1 Tax=Babesia divergens TaxID=32595 RepID=A0AAD9GII1_BABDI|nr:hypothetical protein X943_002733 [Babesia divergens]